MATDLLISFLSSTPQSVLELFSPKPLAFAVPAAPEGQGMSFYAQFLNSMRDGKGNVVPAIFKAAGGVGNIGRVGVMGFSNGASSGVYQMLQANDARKLDFVFACDGMHGSFQKVGGVPIVDPISKKPLIDMNSLGPWVAMARRAVATAPSQNPKGPLFVVTHSSIEPDFPSTTEAANAVWSAAMDDAPQDYEAMYWADLDRIRYPGGMTIQGVTWESFDDGWYDRRAANGFSVFGWGEPGMSPHGRIQATTRSKDGKADHIFQAKAVLPAILTTYLVPRWSAVCGPLTGLGGGGACVPSTEGSTYDEGPEGPLATPVVALPKLPVSCPYPPPGSVIVGSKADPCATSTEHGGLRSRPSPLSTGGKVAAALAGGLVGYLGASWATKAWKRRG